MNCDLCGHHELPAEDNMAADLVLMLDHLRVMHPEEYGGGPERWPDGEIVMQDTTLEPVDFADRPGGE